MKKLFVLFLLTAAAVFGQEQKISLGSHGSIRMFVLGDWNVHVEDYGDRQIVRIEPTKGANADATLTITYPDVDHYPTKARLKARVEVDGARYAPQSTEGKAVGKEYSLKDGFGYHADFTDPDLVGKDPVPGNYKTLSAGLIHLAPDVLIEVTLEADGFSSEPYQQMLGALEGMEFTAGK